MLPPFLGMLLFLGTVAVTGLGLLVWAVAAMRGNAASGRYARRAAGLMAGGYALFWLLGVALPRKEVLPPGGEVQFCGLDCHLHVAVAGVRSGPDLGVTVRFSSNAVQAPEFPGELKFRLRDASGHEYAPTNAVPDRPLTAGTSWSHELHFPAEARPAGATLVVTWSGWLDYFVPGAGNPLAQRRRQLALPAAGA
jgi:hypothetical protein